MVNMLILIRQEKKLVKSTAVTFIDRKKKYIMPEDNTHKSAVLYVFHQSHTEHCISNTEVRIAIFILTNIQKNPAIKNIF